MIEDLYQMIHDFLLFFLTVSFFFTIIKIDSIQYVSMLGCKIYMYAVYFFYFVFKIIADTAAGINLRVLV